MINDYFPKEQYRTLFMRKSVANSRKGVRSRRVRDWQLFDVEIIVFCEFEPWADMRRDSDWEYMWNMVLNSWGEYMDSEGGCERMLQTVHIEGIGASTWHTHTRWSLFVSVKFYKTQYFIGKHKPYVRVQRCSVITYFTCGNRVALF